MVKSIVAGSYNGFELWPDGLDSPQRLQRRWQVIVGDDQHGGGVEACTLQYLSVGAVSAINRVSGQAGFVHDAGVELQAEKRDAFLLQKCADRSEEHTSELQSRPHLVCR